MLVETILFFFQNFIQIWLNMTILVGLFKVIEVIKTSNPKDVQPSVLKEVQKGACHIIVKRKEHDIELTKKGENRISLVHFDQQIKKKRNPFFFSSA